MVIFENYMFEFSVSKDMKLPKKLLNGELQHIF